MELEVLENFNHQIYIQQIKAKTYSYLPQNFLSLLDLIAQTNIEKTGTLEHYNFTVQEALDFRAISGRLINHVVTGSERFPGHFIGPFREIVLSTKITNFLLQYYSNIYLNYSFYSENQKPNSKQSILVSSTAYDGSRINWPGVIKFFFEHRILLPSLTTPISHYLAIVDWYKRDPQKQGYFYIKSNNSILSTNADGSYHAESWEDQFIKQGFESILPIQRIISRFVK
ncbi:131_t:CDS:2, partial [Racocetra persica]